MWERIYHPHQAWYFWRSEDGEAAASVHRGAPEFRKCWQEVWVWLTSSLHIREKTLQNVLLRPVDFTPLFLFFSRLSMWRSKHSNTKTQTMEVSTGPSSWDWWLPSKTLLETHQSLTRCCLWRRSRPRDSKAHQSFDSGFETQKEKEHF